MLNPAQRDESAFHFDPAMRGFHVVYRRGEVNYPYLSDAMWFMTQHKRWGLLRTHPDYLGVASRVNRIDLYEGGAALSGTLLPASSMRSSTLIDGVTWDGSQPAWYADGFKTRFFAGHAA